MKKIIFLIFMIMISQSLIGQHPSSFTSSKNGWEMPALSFFGSLVLFKSDSNIRYILNWVGHMNDSSLQAQITP